jgi:alkanesulfonate monooxygenase SsuD/methylene tetrahydromethanopterin reductase-like flavin-dependent oxidoreductase (luciferase family)
MRVGVQLPEVERPVPWGEMRDIARTIEACGFDSVWVGDHLLYRDPVTGESRGPFEAWTTLAALAEVTERVQIGPLVASTSFHSPAMLAKKAATVDDISGGRLILGLGAGWNRVEYEAFGFPFDRRVDRFEEAFTIVRTLLREGFIDFTGSYYTLRDAELVPRARPDIQMLIGSNGPRMLRIAAPHVQMWNTWYVDFGNEPSDVGPLMRLVDEACRDVGRDPSTLVRTVAAYFQSPRGSGRPSGSGKSAPAVPVADAARHIAELEAAGVGHVQAILDPIDARTVEELAASLGSRA